MNLRMTQSQVHREPTEDTVAAETSPTLQLSEVHREPTDDTVAAETSPTLQLSEVHREPTDDTVAAETSPTLDAPIATPHILGTPEPNKGHKQPLTLPNDVTQTDSKVMPNATTQTDLRGH